MKFFFISKFDILKKTLRVKKFLYFHTAIILRLSKRKTTSKYNSNNFRSCWKKELGRKCHQWERNIVIRKRDRANGYSLQFSNLRVICIHSWSICILTLVVGIILTIKREYCTFTYTFCPSLSLPPSLCVWLHFFWGH